MLGLVLQPLVLSSFQLVGLTGRPGLSGSKPKLRSRTRTRSGEELKWDGSGYWPPKKSVHSQVDKISHQLPPGLLATMSTEVTDAHMLNNGFRILNTISLCVSLQAAWPPCLATGSSRLRPCNRFPLTSFGSSRCPLPARYLPASPASAAPTPTATAAAAAVAAAAAAAAAATAADERERGDEKR